jgi:hypothetical protein
MTQFAHLQTGVGTPTTSSTYFGPFAGSDEADSFIGHVRDEYCKLGTASTMAPRKFQGLHESLVEKTILKIGRINSAFSSE